MNGQNVLDGCIHREDDAWCLGCVGEEWERREKIERLLNGEIEAHNKEMEEYKNEIIFLKAKLYDYMTEF